MTKMMKATHISHPNGLNYNPLNGLSGTDRMPIDQLVENGRNARTHSRKQIAKIAASIERFGFVNPVLIDQNNMVVAGHGRVAGAKKLGWKKVPVLRIEHLNDEEKRAYILADNRLAEEAGWDADILSIELQSLLECDFSIELTGFDTAEIDSYLLSEEDAGSDDENIPALPSPAETVSQEGDLWILGKHRLLCGDATDPVSYKNLLGRAKAGMVFTDPPYNVPIQGHVSGLGKNTHQEFAMASGEMTSGQFEDFLSTVFDRLVQHSRDGSIHYICMDWRHLAELQAAGDRAYRELKNICVWVKSNAGMGTFYRSQHEFIYVYKNGTAPHINNFELGQHGRHRTNVWKYAGVNSFGAGRDEALEMHPTVKPTPMVADAIRDCSNRNAIVLDPFGGSGTTLMAADKTGRCGYLMELDPGYCDTIIRRWQDHTGDSAEHHHSGKTFKTIGNERLADTTDRSATLEI